jgi:hypothetical protein
MQCGPNRRGSCGDDARAVRYPGRAPCGLWTRIIKANARQTEDLGDVRSVEQRTLHLVRVIELHVCAPQIITWPCHPGVVRESTSLQRLQCLVRFANAVVERAQHEDKVLVFSTSKSLVMYCSALVRSPLSRTDKQPAEVLESVGCRERSSRP